MFRCVATLFLAAGLVSCGRKLSTTNQLYDRAFDLQKSGKLQPALENVSQGLKSSAPGSADYWRFYLLKAEILRYLPSGPGQSLTLLDKEPPAEAAFAGIRARRMLDRGWSYYSLSDNTRAVQALDEGLKIARAANDPEMIAKIEFSEAQFAMLAGKADESQQLLVDANRNAEKSGDRGLVAYGLGVLAVLYMNHQRYEDAIPVYEKEISMLASKTGGAAVDAYMNLGLCRYRLYDLDRALKDLERAEQITRQNDDQIRREASLGFIGNIYSDQHDLNAARKYYEQALSASIKGGSTRKRHEWLANLAEVAIESRDWSGATKYNSQALDYAQKTGDAHAYLYALNNSARIAVGEHRLEEGEKLFRRVIESAADFIMVALPAHTQLALLYADSGRDEKAAQEFESAIRVIERSRSALRKDETKLTYLSSLIKVHQSYIDFLMARGKTERALEIAEASRARILQERLGMDSSTTTVPATTYRRMAAEAKATLFSYWLGPNRSYLWVTTPQHTVAYPLPPEATIRVLVENYRSLIESLLDPMQTDDSSGRELYEAILAPAIDQVPPGGRVIIAPDGGLHGLNFETLPVPGERPHYFIEDATVSVVASLNLLREKLEHSERQHELLMIGDPDSQEERFPRLPHAEREISSVEAHFRSTKVISFQNDRAVPAVYRRTIPGSFKFVHFTAHATANPESPLDSSIILTGKTGFDRLTARDVLLQPIDAELVTISACRGAGAKTYAGEGLVGFTWAFFRAGAHNIIAGLWDVSDESTPHLMDVLYRNLTSGASPAEALRDAKLDVMKSDPAFHRPYYWAPFQLYIRELDPPRAIPSHGT